MPRINAVQQNTEASDLRIMVVSELHVSVVIETGNSVPSFRRATVSSGQVTLLSSPDLCCSNSFRISSSRPSFRRNFKFWPTNAGPSQPNRVVQFLLADRI